MNEKTKREAVGKRLRFDIFKRDSFTCVYCGKNPPSVILHCDHVIPVVEGGKNNPENLVTACVDCNLGKSGISLNVIPESVLDRAGRIQEIEEQVRGFNEVVMARQQRIEAQAWIIANIFIEAWNDDEGFRRDWFRSVERFCTLLPLDDLIEAAQIAIHKRPYSPDQTFKYFCGVCWRKVERENVEN